MAAATTLLTLSNGLISAFVMVAMRQLGASFMEIGIVAALYNLALAVTVFLGGSLSGRYGGKTLFILSLVCSLAGMLFYGTTIVVTSWALIALGLLLGRIALGLKDTSSFSIVSNSADEQKKATSFGLLYTFSFAGSILASAMAGVVAFYYDYTLLFILAIPFIVTAMITVILKLGKGQITAKRPLPSWSELKMALTMEKSVTFLLFIALWEQFFAEFGNAYFFVFMQENLKAPEYLLPLPQMSFAVSSLVAGLFVGHFSDRVKKRKPFIVVSTFVTSIGTGLIAFATSPYMMIGAYFLFGFSNVVGFTCLQAYFSDVGKTRGSLIWGTFLAFLWIGGIFSPPISGLIAERYDLRVPFLITMSGLLMEAILLLIFFKEKQIDRA